VPIADLSALAGFPAIQMKKLNSIKKKVALATRIKWMSDINP
jgi:hypothetical protein